MEIGRRIREKRKEAQLTQAQVAEYFGISTPSVSEWEAKNGPSKDRLEALARLLKTSIHYLLTGREPPAFEHIHAKMWGGISEQQNVIYVSEEENKSISRVTGIHPDDPHPDDVVYVPESRIEFSAGNGKAPQYELIEDQEPATYRLSWFQRERINPERVRRFRVSGDSMEPMLFARDTILVNTDETSIVDGKLYAIRYGDDLRVKYLYRRLDGTIILRSVNQAYKDEEVPRELAEEHITIIGRVRDKSGKGGL